MTHFAPPLPLLPLLLWRTPPGLERALVQEGIAFVKLDDRSGPMAFSAGRFVLCDGWASRSSLVQRIRPEHRVIDLADARRALRRETGYDPFAALLDARLAQGVWSVDGHQIKERISRRPHNAIREQILIWLRQRIAQCGGIWARLAPFPAPYRSAFHFRVDLDEPAPDDYWRFAKARRPLEDCVTHFVCTRAYGGDHAIMSDLAGLDAQSHGHAHHVYRDPAANRRNLERADRILRGWGIEPNGFAGPEGRWNPGLDQAIEDLGYRYSSEFQTGWDDWPFFAWRSDAKRFSSVLQAPIHPVCEGIFLEAGVHDSKIIADYYAKAIEAKIRAGKPAFLYGHPERRLGRRPEILEAIANTVERRPQLWRVRMGKFADWWRWRISRSWSVRDLGGGGYEFLLDDWSERYPLGLEILRDRHLARAAWTRPKLDLSLQALTFQQMPDSSEPPQLQPVLRRLPWNWRASVRSWLDWETHTPIEELSADSPRDWIKNQLRRWRRNAGVPDSRPFSPPPHSKRIVKDKSRERSE